MGLVPTIYYCPYENCTASYNRKIRYETHIRTHTGERPFVCSYEGCGKDFTSASHLQRHEGTHGSSFRCTEENCLVILKTKATLKKHIRIVHLKLKKHRVYTCTQCGKDFKKHKTLQNHELRHSGELPHKCSVEDCQKAFLTPSKLKRHMKIHEGYPCKVPHCDKVFGKWSLYVQHVRDFHRPEYKCQLCSKVFCTSIALKKHAPLHKESQIVYPCEVPNCSRYYFAKRNLDWHMRKYHAKRPYMCDKEHCRWAFKTEAELADHILYHGKRKPRKRNKPKKPKPSLAAILSGCAEVKQVNRKSKQVITEENAEPDVLASSSNLADLEPDTTKISSFEANQLSVMEEGDGNCTVNASDNVQNLFVSSQSKTLGSSIYNNSAMESEFLCKENMLEVDESTNGQELDSAYSPKNDIVPIDCETNNSLIELEIPESSVQEYTTIEIVGNGNLSQVLSVPLIKVDGNNWNKSVAVHIETAS